MVRWQGARVLVAIAFCSACGHGTSSAPGDEMPGDTRDALCDVERSNPALAAHLRELLSLSEGEPVTVEDLRQVDAFSATGLESLDGVQCMTGMWQLSLTDLRTADLSPLAGLGQLRVLSIASSVPPDLSQLRAEPDELRLSLMSLAVRESVVSDISALDGFERLTSLSLTSNELSSLQTLPRVRQLASVELSRNPLEDLSPLLRLPELDMLTINGLPLRELRSLSGAPALREVMAHDSRIETLDGLDLPALETLYLTGNRLGALGNVSGLPLLDYLLLSDNELESLSGIERLSALTSLNVSRNPLTSLGGVESLTKLQLLELADTQVSDLTPLAGLLLTTLNVRNAAVSDFAPLAPWAEVDGRCRTLIVPNEPDAAALEIFGSLCTAGWEVVPLCKNKCRELAL